MSDSENMVGPAPDPIIRSLLICHDDNCQYVENTHILDLDC